MSLALKKESTKSIVFAIVLLFSLTWQVFSQNQVQCPLKQDSITDPSIFDREKITQACLNKALIHDWSSVIKYLIENKLETHQQQFIKIFANEINRLNTIEEQIILDKSETQPVIKWFQNQTHVFITLKLSHRWDSPPCLNTHEQKSSLQSNTFTYENNCLVSHQKINFKTQLDLFKNIVTERDSNNPVIQQQSDIMTAQYFPYKFQVKKDGVGQYSTVILKQKPQIWLFLTKQRVTYPIWYEITTRYKDQFRQYQRQLEAYNKFIQNQQAKRSGSTKSLSQKTLKFAKDLGSNAYNWASSLFQ